MKARSHSKDKNMWNALIQDTRRNAGSYGSLPFWSWNDRLEEEELRKQIRNMKSLGMNGFFMHARSGLTTEYMSDEWFRAIEVCIDEAKKLGMEAWSYDENGWPSGFAGGKLLREPENLARYLSYSVEPEFPTDALAVFIWEDNRAIRVLEACAASQYHVIRTNADETYIDILNREVVAKFIKETHEVYKARIRAEDFGNAMPGFFTDEPQYYRQATPWSNILAARFLERYGYDIMENLLALFTECEGFKTLRHDYHRLIADLYIDSFVKQIYEWCEKNGCRLTGHTIIEETLAGQLSCCGSAMRFYEYEHIPGIDWLGRPLRTDALPRQLGSVCAQLGKKKALSETFAMCGWDVSPRELKNIADLQYAGGVNLTCQHLYAYSSRGNRKLDYPVHFSEYLPWQKHLRDFNEYYNNLGYLLSRGKENVRTLVLHPIRTAYLYYVREREETVSRHNAAFCALSDRLSEHQLAYHYGDEDILREHASVEGANLRVGECVYDRIVLPEVETLDASTASLLREYLQNGGRLIMLGKAPTLMEARPSELSWLVGNMSFEQWIAEAELSARTPEGSPIPDLRVMGRLYQGKRFFFVTNIRKATHRVRITVQNCDSLVKLDPRDLSLSPVFGEKDENGSFTAAFVIGDSESFLLMEDETIKPLPLSSLPSKRPPVFLPPAEMKLSKHPTNQMTLDSVYYRLGEQAWQGPVPLMGLSETLLRTKYKGKLTVRMDFEVETPPSRLLAALEALPYTALRVNGSPAAFGNDFFLERSFRTVDITTLVKKGKNTLEYELDYYQRDYVHHVLFDEGVSETLRNCLLYDTELGESYLFGDFTVKTDRAAFEDSNGGIRYRGGFALAECRDSVRIDNITKDGYPFFAGEMVLSFPHIHKTGDPTRLRLDGRYAVCEVSVNGKKAGKLFFDSELELSDRLCEGENTVELTLVNSNRNLLGPLHDCEIEPLAVGPKTFTCCQTWNEDITSPRYLTDCYCFVRFGLDSEKK